MKDLKDVNTSKRGLYEKDSSETARSFLVQTDRNWGVELRGIHPVDVQDRTETQFSKIFFIWFSANTNVLSFSTGTLGPVAFGLGLRDSCLTILFFNLLCAIPPAYFTTWGPKLGLRQLCASRYTFGYHGVIIPGLFSLIGGVGFCILSSILGGQSLATVGNISCTVGIVITSVITLLVSFCGLKVLSWYERLAWIPLLATFIIATAVSGNHFIDTPRILTFGATIAGFTMTWAASSSDYTAYFHPGVSSWRIFLYSYLGLNIPIIAVQCLGAAAAISAPSVPDWDAGYAGGNVGGLIDAMLHPVGGFGKFLMVLVSFSVTGSSAPTMYSLCMALQTVAPPLVVVPRYLISVFATAVILPLSIVGQHKFYATLSNFLGLIGYWAGAWVSALIVEHLYFRKGDFMLYDTQYWNVPSKLPLGAAALGASTLSFALVIPSMDQVWYTGPIARKTGDIGFEVAIAVTALLYVPLRHIEKRWRGV
ncbi:NCS cytosine-purine permease [Multifurca ochricompacta]|uniref:NCS cytosine-purine permease n=1 Tax=Multifurca ochricompacta TaxID=376703 RepID=A0AAD4M859_9AGAM|nr:NCS cytosine-purine permease [Multifurca ochricompacta]